MVTASVYEIVNSVTGQRYVGSAINLRKRSLTHFRQLRGGFHDNSRLQRAYNKYGDAAFVIKEIVSCAPHNVVAWEQTAMDALLPEYNLSPTAASTLGYRFTDEQKKKISQSLLGKKLSKPRSAEYRLKQSISQKKRPPRTPEQRLRMSIGQKNKAPITDETRKKLSEAKKGKSYNKGYKWTDEQKAAHSIAMSAKPTFLGKKHTAETKEKIRQARLGTTFKQSEEFCRKLSERMKGNKNNLGRVTPEETKAKISAAQKGRIFSDETKAKMSLAQKNKGPVSEETKAKMRASHAGRVVSEEVKQKCRDGWARRKERLSKEKENGK